MRRDEEPGNLVRVALSTGDAHRFDVDHLGWSAGSRLTRPVRRADLDAGRTTHLKVEHAVIDWQSDGDDPIAVEVSDPCLPVCSAHYICICDVKRARADDRRAVGDLVLRRFGTGDLHL